MALLDPSDFQFKNLPISVPHFEPEEPQKMYERVGRVTAIILVLEFSKLAQ